MNKNMKGAVAIGAATVLLLGGGGTLAVWNATDDVAGGSIYSGQLSLAGGDTAEGSWYFYDTVTGQDDCNWYSDNGDEVTLDPTNGYPLVPGDDVIFCVDGLELSAQGGELYFTIDGTDGSVSVTDTVTGDPVDETTYEAENIFVTAGINPTIPGSVQSLIAGLEQYTAAGFVDQGADVYGVAAEDGLVTIPISAFIHVDMSDYVDIVSGQQWQFDLGGNSGVDISQVIKLF